MSFTHAFDQMSWRWNNTWKFSVHSLYKFINFRGIQHVSPLIWWRLPVPPKIQVFMWLVFRNRILTKDNLRKRGWDGDITCMFCGEVETANHLLSNCFLVQQILCWLGQSHLHFHNWNSLQDVFDFSLTLTGAQRTAFLVVFSAMCWTLLKHRNEVCFNNSTIKTARNIIFLIISLVMYWAGHKKFKQTTQEAAQDWLPSEDVMDAIPLRVILPGAEDSIPFQMIEVSSAAS